MQTIDVSHFQVLQIIYQLVKNDPYPLKCKVHPRELILRLMQDWHSIQCSLVVLEKEGAIVTRQLDSLQISLTQHGLDLCKTIEE